jgi:hypothetical protein
MLFCSGVPWWIFQTKSKSHYNWRSVGQSVSMSRYRAYSGTCDQILLSVRRLFSESCCLVSVERPLRREVGSVLSRATLLTSIRHIFGSTLCCDDCPRWFKRTVAIPNMYDYQPDISQSFLTTDSQSASQSWCQAKIRGPRPNFMSPWNFP